MEDVITDGPSMPITFNRSKNPFRELCRIYKNSANKLVRPPVVYFVSESGKEDLLEEEAADIGGPLREFFTIALESLSKETAPQLFEGDDDHKLPVHSQQLVLCGYFKMMGEIVAICIIANLNIMKSYRNSTIAYLNVITEIVDIIGTPTVAIVLVLE